MDFDALEEYEKFVGLLQLTVQRQLIDHPYNTVGSFVRQVLIGEKYHHSTLAVLRKNITLMPFMSGRFRGRKSIFKVNLVFRNVGGGGKVLLLVGVDAFGV